MSQERTEFFEKAWTRCEDLIRDRTGGLSVARRQRIAATEKSNVNPSSAWPGVPRAAARRHAHSGRRSAFPCPGRLPLAVCFPVPARSLPLRRCGVRSSRGVRLKLLAESIDAENPERLALDLFDRLRLREPLAQAFNALGFEGEEGWRVAGRIKVLLLVAASVGQPQPEPQKPATVAKSPAETAKAMAHGEPVPEKDTKALAPASAAESKSNAETVALAPDLWLDPDVRWLTGVHDAEGHAYFIREHYEELLWWLLMPSLLRLAGEANPTRSAAKAMAETVQDALAEASAARYRVDVLIKAKEGLPANLKTTDAHNEDSSEVAKAGNNESREESLSTGNQNTGEETKPER